MRVKAAIWPFSRASSTACRWMSAQASIRARILGCSSNRNRREPLGIVITSIMMIALSAACGEGRSQLRNSFHHPSAGPARSSRISSSAGPAAPSGWRGMPPIRSAVFTAAARTGSSRRRR